VFPAQSSKFLDAEYWADADGGAGRNTVRIGSAAFSMSGAHF